jgi:hypothetical protein
MPKRKPFEGDIVDIEKAMKESKNCAEFRRIQCVYLGMLHPNMSSKEISKVTLYHENYVRAIHMNYRKNGLLGLVDNRGGRYRQNLTLAEDFLHLLKKIAKMVLWLPQEKLKKPTNRRLAKKSLNQQYIVFEFPQNAKVGTPQTRIVRGFEGNGKLELR